MDWAKLNADFMEEIGDSMKYAKMAETAEGCTRQMLMDMAWDEWNHAKHICFMLKGHGLSEAGHKEQLHKAKEALVEIQKSW